MFNFMTPKVPKVDAEVVKNAIDAKKDFILLDVRTREEYVKNHLSEAINIPVDEVAEKALKIIPDKNKTIYVYCFSGSRSILAVDALIQLGYKKVFDMSHGMLAWRAKGYPS
jgi:phage shock protein E